MKLQISSEEFRTALMDDLDEYIAYYQRCGVDRPDIYPDTLSDEEWADRFFAEWIAPRWGGYER